MKPALRVGGAITSLVTPFRDDTIDTVGLMAHVEWQLLSGIDGLLACSLTGEGPVLTAAERVRIIEICAELAEGRVPVIVATGTNNTATTIEETRQAQALGADAAFVTLPYYSKPSQKGLVHHFERLAASTDLPLIIHNLPAHTAIDLTPATVARLAEIPTIIGIADGSGDIGRISTWRPLLPERIGLYSTHDATALAFTMAGGRGSFSSAANIAPRLFRSMQLSAACDHMATALLIDDRLRPLLKALAREPEPATVKHALSPIRDISPDVRLPLTGVEAETDAAIRTAMASLQLAYQSDASSPRTFRTGL
ncbi:4-hydroxy-tetrahydrodipicolinate synthase [Rhizobium sp. BR 317]|uniref:4-hydroxy-tetrahydrodipicolinate synthase n=2 Tax=Rhizobium/Agrobacterium group TaxID=227290 RepID=A0A7W9CZT1_9HYPH|nr:MULTISPECIES: 4-hydroxy-tetrahydrodipicolinate synthase [Rhizobium]MBB5572315.1 4-hydroxy-tetrahydrodipicolinate synthase [Rhizobium paranaense]